MNPSLTLPAPPPGLLSAASAAPGVPASPAPAAPLALPTALLRSAGQALRSLDAWMARPRSPRQVVVALSLYLVLAANWPLWGAVARMGGAPSLYLRAALALALLVACGTVALLSLTAWTRGMKPVWFAVVLVAALAQHYMLTYRVVMDPGMGANLLQTDWHEASDLLGWRMLPGVLAVLWLPAWWLLRVRLVPLPVAGQLWRNAVLLALSLGLAAATAAVFARDLAPLMRNHPMLRYQINPLASLYSTTVAVLRPLRTARAALVPMTAGAALGATHAAQTKPLLLVLVVGETARADHFGLNGYGRDTTPALAARGVFNWRQVQSCGTSTMASLPCMFSPLGKDAFEARSSDTENLLDVVQAAGLNVLWLDNQSGCKGVCDRVPHASAADAVAPAARQALCDSTGECHDTALLGPLAERLEALTPAQRARGTLVVLHQMGSHGPAYFKRSSAASKRFMPECRTEVLAECSPTELVNAYDNSIVETDAFLGQTIDWLQGQSAHFDTGMVYLSDHGESLGEYGLFLHGMPYRIAPEAQKHVPLVAWMDADLLRRLQLSGACLRASANVPLTHDALYHSVLGLADVQSPSYRASLDAFAGCRQAVKATL